MQLRNSFSLSLLGQNQWTGGQYSLFRMIFGSYLLCHFVQLIPYGAELFSNRGMLPTATASPILYAFPNLLALCDTPWFVIALLLVAVLLSGLFLIGLYDRAAAIGLWYLWACLFGRNPLIANPSLPYVGVLLLAHACLPPAPYGSWQRRKNVEPDIDWRLPPAIYLVVWILMAVGYSYSGYTKLISVSWLDGSAFQRILENPLARPSLIREWMLTLPSVILQGLTWGALGAELLFAPLALFRKLRPLLWGVLLLMHVGLIALIDFADLSLGMVMLHLFTFNPGWIKPLQAKVKTLIFYDGNCGLCHRAVRFFIAEDQEGKAFRFAPLNSNTFQVVTTATQRAALPDSMVVMTTEQELIVRSAAVIYLLKRLGGIWRVLASAAEIFPRRLRDGLYDLIASNRYQIAAKPKDICPMLPAHLRVRFDY
jgi:predicted DCC family thiol-disulfide oxidoreductase YuxK